MNADGSFSYTPVFDFVGAETFSYTLSNPEGDSTATVTMTSTGRGFFVNNQAGPTGNGSQADPFDALTDATAVAGDGDTIFVSRGDGTDNGLFSDITLAEGVNLIGEGQGLVLGQTVVPQGQAPVFDARVTILGNNTISGFTFTGDSAACIFGDGFTNVTISNNTFTGDDSDQILLDGMQGTISIINNVFSLDADADAIDTETAASGTCDITINGNTFQLLDPTADADDCIEIGVDGTAVATIQVNDNRFNGLSTASSSLETGLDIYTQLQSQATLTASGNQATLMDSAWLEMGSFQQSTLTVILTDNVIDQTNDNDINVSVNSDSNSTLVLESNRLTDSTGQGVAVTVGGDSTLDLALRNNVITGTNSAAARIDAAGTSDLCAEITGNTFGANLEFVESTTGSFRVEQFGNAMGNLLATLNTFTSGSIVVSGTVESVADGNCLIP